jgi:hypothetical protein
MRQTDPSSLQSELSRRLGAIRELLAQLEAFLHANPE